MLPDNYDQQGMCMVSATDNKMINVGHIHRKFISFEEGKGCLSIVKHVKMTSIQISIIWSQHPISFTHRCIIPFIDRREYRFFCGYPKDVHNENGAFRVTDEHMRGGCSAPQEDDQVTWIILSSPLTPARAQRLASSVMVLRRYELDGCKPSKMAAFLCFQMNQAVMTAREAKPLRC